MEERERVAKKEREIEEEKPKREALWRERGLHEAAENGELEVVKYLCEKAKVNKFMP